MKTYTKGSKKLLNAWAFYDWANSVYPLTITSAIFPIFYSSLFLDEIRTVKAFGIVFNDTSLITLLTSFTFIIIAFISPLLSGIADYMGNKKRFMQFFCYFGAAGCIGLYWFSLDKIHLSLLFYFMGLLGFWGSLVFYNSFLPDIAFPNQQDAISAKGFSLGYTGSVILLVFNVIMLMRPDWFGLVGENAQTDAMRIAFLTVGIWWIIFSQYPFRVLPKGNKNKGILSKDIFWKGFKELHSVWKELDDNKRLKSFLRAFFVYSMAVQTIMFVAVYFGEKEINWGSTSAKFTGLVLSILLIQIVAIIGANLTSKLSEKKGNIPVLIGINSIWMLLCFYGYFVESPIQFYFTAGAVGLVMGGVQSLSRSTYSKFLPKTQDTTSYFSFYDVSEKIGIVIGMGIFGLIDLKFDSMRNAIVFLFVFFLIGIYLLFRVKKYIPK